MVFDRSDAPAMQHRLSPFSGEFADPAVEAAFRRRAWPQDRTTHRMIVAVCLGFYVPFFYVDWVRVAGDWAGLAPVFALRGVLVCVCLVLLALTRRPTLPGSFDRLATLSLVLLYATFFAARTNALGSPPLGAAVLCLLILVAHVIAIARFWPTVLLSLAAALIHAALLMPGFSLGGESFYLLVLPIAGCAFGLPLARGTNVAKRRMDIMADRQREALIAAEEASRAKSSFLAMMSHELRTPLNAVIGFADIMRREMLGPIGTPRYREYVDHIHASGTHLLGIIAGILDFTKLEAGQWEVHPVPVDAAQVAEGAMVLVRPEADRHRVTLLPRFDPATPVALADARGLKQILLNLLSNAVKFTPDGGTVTVRVGPGLHGMVLVEVVDTGVGMTPAELARAMEPFGQVENAEIRRELAGTGLGLPISEKLAQAMGAQLTLSSHKGHGTRASLLLPSAPADDTRAGHRVEAAEEVLPP